MATKWVITTPSDRVDLDGAQQGQTTFTVTNPTSRTDRAVFDVVPGDGADPAWFSVEEPQRRVAADGSVSYLVKTAVPATAAPGSYSVQGRVYSADSTPEEDSVLSSRLVVRVDAKAAPEPKKRPWWILVVAGLVVVVLVVVGLVVGLGGPKHAPPAAPAAQVDVPDVAKESESQARTNLAVFGLRVGTVRHKVAANPDTVIYQSVPGGTMVAKGTAVDLVVAATLAAPVVVAPAAGGSVLAAAVAAPTTPVPTTPTVPSASAGPSADPRTSAGPSASAAPPVPPKGVLRWTDPDPFVHRWQIVLQQQICGISVNLPFVIPQPGCFYLTSTVVEVTDPWYDPILQSNGQANPPFYNMATTPVYQWHVTPVDDFGGTGTPSGPVAFTVK